MGENEEHAPSQSIAVLTEILGVLKRIDGHLESQESRIGVLDAKVTALALNANLTHRQVSLGRKENQNSPDGRVSPGTSRKESLAENASLPRPRDLRLQIADRADSVASRNPRASIASQGSRPWSGTHVWNPTGLKRVNSDKIMPWGSISRDLISNSKTTAISRTGTWHSVPPPPTAAETEQIDIDDDPSYHKFPPPQEWITTRFGRVLDVKYSSAEARALWTSYVGDSWTIPPDGRIEMTFQQHLLERLDKDKVTDLLQTLRDVSNRLEYQHSDNSAKGGSFRVTDFGFDVDFEESTAEYRAEFFTAKYREHPIPKGTERPSLSRVQTAPWKRMIEVRGLSKKLIDEHETWTQNFRDPWTEALPLVSPVLPFLTDRERDSSHKKYTGMNAVNEALLYHQQCLRRLPRNDEHLTFHITFYEVVDLTCDNELDEEIWKSGKLHSDNEKELENLYGVKSRRIRDSACTLVVVPDQEAKFWTSISMYPSNFAPFEAAPAAIMKREAQEIFISMVEFTMQMVVERWTGIANYFAGLIGHQDTLSDPDAHDSLLFDDDTFSRSRKYFWAINYLAEMDSRISWNILNLEGHIGWGGKLAAKHQKPFHGSSEEQMLTTRLNQLQDLRTRLRGLREEAIALRDGLFSASAVIESRASTRLGENVKLLTFVSIFFLPLSFCMSVWSINNTIFSLKALLIVAILVGLGTYLVVFNLNNMVNFTNRLYDMRKKKLIAQMRQDADTRWNEQGKRFATFKPKQENFKPSEWVIGLFILHQIIKWLTFRWVFKKKPKPPTDEDPGETYSPQQLSGFPDTADFDLSKNEDPPKITKMQIKDRATTQGPLSKLSKVFRRGALSSTPAHGV